MSWQLLNTDIPFFLLLIAMVFFAWYSRRHPHLLMPWRRLTHNRLGMAAATVLSVFVLIAFLDSIHLRQTQGAERGEVLSVLDLAMTDIRTQQETTYSAPFAAYAYSKEMVVQPDGTQRRSYPRLQYGGAHLTDPGSEKIMDMVTRGLTGAVFGALLSAVIYMVWMRRRSEKNIDAMGGKSSFLTLAIILIVGGAVISLAQSYHVLGTDKVGQDVLYQTLKSIRTALIIGLLTTMVMLPLAVVLGVSAGYFRGWVDDLIQFIYTTLSSIPSVLLIAAAVLMMQVYMANHPELFDSLEARSDLRLLLLCVILGITSWTGLCRLLRAETLKLRDLDYMHSAKAAGANNGRILRRHILPNVMHIVLIQVTLDFSGLILAEAVLSYVGVGVDPSTHSWGNMINGARLELAREPVVWWSLMAAFGFMFSLVLAANLFADALRDAFDPRLKMG